MNTKQSEAVPVSRDIELKPYPWGGEELTTLPAWQPIATAPKDGTLIDIWIGGQRTADVKWCLPYQSYNNKQRPPSFCQYGVVDYDGIEGWEELYQEWSVPPTHWMPIPSAPEANNA